jgi:L-asparaginase
MTTPNHHVLIVFTGGTISVSPSRDTANPALGGTQLTEGLRQHLDVSFEIVDLYRAMSESLTFSHLERLAEFLLESMKDTNVSGVVVSHGTDTMEEVAYFIDLLGPWEKPIVFTGAMRHSELLSADGPANLVNAIRTAASPLSVDRGVMVVMNEEIHAARSVVKGHSTNVASFVSLDCGPIGNVVEGTVRYYGTVSSAPRYFDLPKQDSWPRVELVRMTLGSSGLLLQACLAAGVDGVVIEGFGAGHVPDYLLPDIEALVRSGTRVWVVPRTPGGYPLLATYNTPGSEVSLQSIGVRMEEGPGYKARLRMMLELCATS